MFLQSFETVFRHAQKLKQIRRVAVAGAADPHVIEAVIKAYELGFAEPILIGDKNHIIRLLEVHNAQSLFTVIEAGTPVDCGKAAVAQVNSGDADFLMKGMVETRDLLRPLVNKENGLFAGKTMSHMGFFQLPGVNKLMVITDGGMVISPTLEEKRDIIKNAATFLRGIGYSQPKVAVLSAVEYPNPHMQEAMDAQALAEMNMSGEISGCIVVGPISYDLAMSAEAARIKHYDCPHSGDFDILVVPNIACGNILAKSWIYTAGAHMAGLVVGAKVPVVVTSRGSSAEEKLLSLALAAISSIASPS